MRLHEDTKPFQLRHSAARRISNLTSPPALLKYLGRVASWQDPPYPHLLGCTGLAMEECPARGEHRCYGPKGPRRNKGTIGQGDNKRPKTTNPQGHQGPEGCPGHLPTTGSLPAPGWPGAGWFPLLLSWMLLPREVNPSPGVLLGGKFYSLPSRDCQMLLYSFLPVSLLILFFLLFPRFPFPIGDEN